MRPRRAERHRPGLLGDLPVRLPDQRRLHLREPCVGDGTCATGTASGQTIQKCQAGTDVAKCKTCPGGFCDGAGQCNASACGDGCIDTSKGEQCDDGNLLDLDGCDATCKYEVVARMTAIAISGTSAPAALGCAPGTNRLGAQGLTSVSLGVLNSGLTTDIDNGTVNVMTQLLGLTDLTGVSSAPFTLGVLDATFDPAKGKPVNNPIDWWFLADPATVSAGLPTWSFTNATLAARNLRAGSSNITLMLGLGGSPEQLAMIGAHIAATLNGNPPPDAPAPPPAALAPGLTVFQTMTGNGAGQGLCGNVTVASLAASPVPSVFAQGGSMGCSGSRIYTPCTGTQTPNDSSCNSLLDVLVGGCSTFGGLTTEINTIATGRARRGQGDPARPRRGQQGPCRDDDERRGRLLDLPHVHREPRPLHGRDVHDAGRLPDGPDLHGRRLQVTEGLPAP